MLEEFVINIELTIMKISYNWLKDYLAVDLPPTEAAKLLTDIGLEVEGLDKAGGVEGNLEGLVVGHVKEAVQHPNADRLRLTTVDVGGEEDLNIVCGAPNVAAGQKVVVATVGTTLYPTEGKSFKIKKGKIRGEVSMGMICAEDEIGLGHSHDGIMVLPEETKVGTPLREVIELKEDFVFEIGLTPNRSDATNHIGVAKDLAAGLQIQKGLDSSVQLPDVSAFKVDSQSLPIEVEVRDSKLCPRYSGVSIKGVTIKESPEWLKEKLESIGVKSINNIVDITNFILHELGQPLHAFDADKIVNNKIIVQTLPQDTPFITLDEDERKLNSADLMICDGEDNGMCIAGVYGGANSGVKDSTTNIFLESACFDAVNIRRTALKHLLRTDAAIRFEKGVDPNNSVYALKRAALLIQELAGGEIASEIVDIYPNKIERAEVAVKYANVNRLIGVDLSPVDIDQIIQSLEMEVVQSDEEGFTVAVPTNKVDVTREADMIEEILRIYGFDRVPMPTRLHASLSYSNKPNKAAIKRSLSEFLAANGFNEMMGTSVSRSRYYEDDKEGLVMLLNSLNAELDCMRKNMVYSGLEAIKHNNNRKNGNIQFFEFGKTYQVEGEGYSQQSHLTLYLHGKSSEEGWRQKQTSFDFYNLKQTVEAVMQRFGLVANDTEFIQNDEFAYGLNYTTRRMPLVEFGQLQSKQLKKVGVKGQVFYANFNYDTILKVLKTQKIKYSELNKFPATRRDLALVLDDSVKFEEVQAIAIKTGKKLLKSVNLFDVFTDAAKLGDNKKSYAVSFIFEDHNKTLTDKEVDKIMNQLMQNYESKLQAIIRK